MNAFERMYREIGRTLRRRRQREAGAAMVEYALLLAGIAIVVGAAVAAFGTRLVGAFNGFAP